MKWAGVLVEADLGLLCQGDNDGIEIQGRVFRGWTTRKEERPSLGVKCTRNQEYLQGTVKSDEVSSGQK